MASSISALRVYLERVAVPVRAGRPQSRRHVLAVAASSPDKSNAASETPATPPNTSGSNIKVDVSPDDKEEGWKQPLSPAQIFGSYLQVGVWVVVLSAAGFTGFQKAQTDPDQVGILLAPPAAAIFLFVAFAAYRIANNENFSRKE